MTTKFQIIYWRDIPAQVKVHAGTKRVTRPLSGRFQEAIDQAAMRTKATKTDDYLEMWRTSDWKERDGDPESVADALANELEMAYTRIRLETLVLSGGHENESDAGGVT
ncbi:MAG TPA: virulence factor [Acidobacteriota bacterium]|jgi:hypothetical protein